VVEPGCRCLGDRYELSQLIAAGGMGQVWRGRDVLLGRPVAVKVLRSEYTGDSTFLARFRAEAQHAASLSHPNIAAVFDYGEAEAQDGSGESLAYLVMELVEGEPLSSVLRREGPLDVPTTLGLLQQTAFALAEAHRVGMVHRDVKPGNILVRTDGSVKITDFGIAWSAGSVPLTRTGQVIGTPQYLSPEQAQGQQATPASDVYALGLVGYECLTGHSAFAGDNPVTIALKQLREQPEPLPAQLPPGVRTLITRALAKDPAQRLPDGAAFVSAVEDALAGRDLPEAPPTVAVFFPPEAAVAAPATGPVRMPPPPRRPLGRRIALVLVPLLTLLTGAAVAAVIVHGLGADPGSPAVAAQTHNGDGFVLVADDYLGRPVDDVAIQLSALGLSVHRHADRNSDAPAGSVTAVNPVGVRLHVGDVVTVRYAVGSGEPAGGSSAEQRQQAARGSLVADTSQSPAMEVAGGTGVGPATTTSTPTSAPAVSSSVAATTPTTSSDPQSSSSSSDPGSTSSSPTDSTTSPADSAATP
jgi:serine/threonine-protein kinase